TTAKMHAKIITLAGFLAVASAQLSSIPACAQQCFINAVLTSSCDPTNYYCQCTTGQATIAESVVLCLCQSTCSESDLSR
ncbi:hypothetical protein, partial [Staphylococcus aureus]